MRSAIRSWLVSPEAAAPCSISCLILSRRIAIRSLSSDSESELSLLMVHPLGDCLGWARRGERLCPSYTLTTLLLRGLQYRDVVRNRRSTHVEDAAKLRVRELHAFGRLSSELHRRHHMHGDAGCADRMAFGLQPAGRVDRQLAVLLAPAFQDGPRPLPPRRQPHRLIFDQLGDGEAVVGFD